jgi:hypothetical protein
MMNPFIGTHSSVPTPFSYAWNLPHVSKGWIEDFKVHCKGLQSKVFAICGRNILLVSENASLELLW